MLGVVVLYIIFHRIMAAYLRRARGVGQGVVFAALASDVLVLFIAIALSSPPEHYDRALIISLSTVQLTQIFFGWTATLVNLAMIIMAYLALVALAVNGEPMVVV